MIHRLYVALATLATVATFFYGTGWASIPPLVIIWGVTTVAVIPTLHPLEERLALPLHWLRTRAGWFGFVLFAYGVLAVGFWIQHYQPVWGRAVGADMIAYGLCALWGALALATFGVREGDGRSLAAAFSKSRATGALITLTTLAIVLLVVELGMRVFMIQSDGFAFTAMHYWWQQLYWKPINSLGYRDEEPNRDANLKHILVVGDSFPSGHGINRLEDTFPHVLERMLWNCDAIPKTDFVCQGQGYSVNIAAQPGWDTNAELPALADYPVQPNIAVLSYVYNDIGYALPENPVRFTFPQPPWDGVVRDFFVVNFLYWHVFQFGIEQYGQEYVDLLLQAYRDPAIWAQQEGSLKQLVAWTEDRDIRLIVLIWPALNDLDGSRPSTEQVARFFQAQGITVLNMSDALAGSDPSALMVNPFDAHPNIATHRRAAEWLYRTIAP